VGGWVGVGWGGGGGGVGGVSESEARASTSKAAELPDSRPAFLHNGDVPGQEMAPAKLDSA
jgi:hypothetical protein